MNTEVKEKESKVFWREFPSDTHLYYLPASNSLFIFFFLYFEHCEQWSCAACCSIFSLCIRVLRLCPVLMAVYRLSNITTQITFWEIIVIQFVCSSEKPIVCLEKLSGSESDLCPIKRGISLSLMTQ